MVSAKEKQEALLLWKAHCRDVYTTTELSRKVISETPLEKSKRIKLLRSSYQEFCEYYFPHYLTRYDLATGEAIGISHNAKFHNDAAKYLFAHRVCKALFMWPRGHAKSTHMGIFIPCWLMFQEKPQIHLGLLVNKSEDGAKNLLSDLQAELEFNQRLIADYGEQKNSGSWEDGKFTTQKGITWMAVGRGQSPRGLRKTQYRPDYILIDDFDDDQLCENEERVRKATAWVKSALFGALDVGRGRFIMVGNRISKNSVLQNIAETKGVHVSTVMAVDNDGNPIWKEKWTKEEAEEYAAFVGYYSWQKEMMNNPITEGSIFRHDWIHYKKVLPLDEYKELVCYTDPSWKSSRKNDYKASRLWGKIGNEFHLINCYVRQDTIGGMVRWLYNLYETLPENVAVRFYMEAIMLQDTILDEFEAEGRIRGYQLPILPDKRSKPDKVQRIEAISPFWERGWVYYNEDLKENGDMKTGLAQTLALAHGSAAHDDAPDADEGAIWMLQRSTRKSNNYVSLGSRPRPKNNW